MAYTLHLTAEDMETVQFVGNRYSWADAILDHCEEGDNEIPEHVAWELQGRFEEDTEGGHSYFPMLDGRSDLAEKLYNFMMSIV